MSGKGRKRAAAGGVGRQGAGAGRKQRGRAVGPRRSLPPAARPFTRLLLRWFRRHGRALPWRATRDPYRVLVSEFMLQQTQVARVTEYYDRFLIRYPTVEALSRARPAAVRESWAGLGYYARATNLHRLAQRVVREYGGTIPSDVDVLRSLPGVGPYTAGAIACFAFEQREAAVDTNVARVLRRVFTRAGRRGERPEQVTSRRIWQLARSLVPRGRKSAWEFNQALMDLGATICVSRAPRCPQCPVGPACRTGQRAMRP